MPLAAVTAPGLSAAQPGSRSARYRRVMESLCIRDEQGHLVTLRFSASQEHLWAPVAPKLDAHEKLWFIVLKGRQVYATTFFEALTFVRTVEQPGTHSVLIAQNLEDSHEIFNMVKRFYDHLPMPRLAPPRVKELVFPFPGGTSRFRVLSAGSAAKGRGTTQSCVHCSEVAYWPRPELLTGLIQAVPDLPDTVWVLESTANGKRGIGELFYQEWSSAISGESDLVPLFLPFTIMPKYQRSPPVPPEEWDEEERIMAEQFGVNGRQLQWRRATIKTKCKGDPAIFAQEYPLTPEQAFLASGSPAFEALAVLRQRPAIPEPIRRGRFADAVFVPDRKGEVRLWAEPTPQGRYVIGADSAVGTEVGARNREGDYAAAVVLDMATLEQVASVHGHIPTWEFAKTLNALGRYYAQALLAVEINGVGHAVQDPLIRLYQYPNLHRWKGKPDRVYHGRARLFGWETNVYSRPLMIEAGRRAINTGLVTIREEKLLAEIAEFKRSDEGKYEADYGHDDRVVALLIALRSREENYFGPRRRVDASMSEPSLPLGLRVVDHTALEEVGSRRISRLLRERVQQGVKHWMSY